MQCRLKPWKCEAVSAALNGIKRLFSNRISSVKFRPWDAMQGRDDHDSCFRMRKAAFSYSVTRSLACDRAVHCTSLPAARWKKAALEHHQQRQIPLRKAVRRRLEALLMYSVSTVRTVFLGVSFLRSRSTKPLWRMEWCRYPHLAWEGGCKRLPVGWDGRHYFAAVGLDRPGKANTSTLPSDLALFYYTFYSIIFGLPYRNLQRNGCSFAAVSNPITNVCTRLPIPIQMRKCRHFKLSGHCAYSSELCRAVWLRVRGTKRLSASLQNCGVYSISLSILYLGWMAQERAGERSLALALSAYCCCC